MAGSKRLGILSLMCAALMASTSAVAGETYRINLSPPAHPGETYYYTSDQQEHHFTIGGIGQKQVLDSELHFGATANIESCDNKGHPSRVRFELNYFQPMAIGGVELMPPGTEVTARSALIQNQPPLYTDVFELKDAAIDESQNRALAKVITIGSPVMPTEQELMGPTEPVAVGDNWKLSAEHVSNLFARVKIIVDPKSAAGTGRLARESKIGSHDCLEVRIYVTGELRATAGHPGEGKTYGSLHYDLDKKTGLVVESAYSFNAQVTVPHSDFEGRPTPATMISDLYRRIGLDTVSK